MGSENFEIFSSNMLFAERGWGNGDCVLENCSSNLLIFGFVQVGPI